MELTKYEQPMLTGGVFAEFPRDSEWDAIVIGAGPNGLMTAAYLAKAGLKVAIIERRYEIGGGLVTEEILHPCYYSNAHVIYHLMVDYMPVLRDFNLDNHGMAWVKPNLQTAMVFEDGGSLLLTRMVEDTRDSIMRYSVKDAIAFGKLMRTYRHIVDDIIAPLTYLPAMSPTDLGIVLDKTDVGRELWDIAEQSPYEIITSVFENDRVRALMLYVTCMWGLDPKETGVGLFVPLLLMRGMNKCYCYGGSHKFAGALGREVVGNGGTILDTCEVTKIIMDNGHAAGVETSEGRILRSKVIISSLDPHTTFLDLVGSDNLPGNLKEAVEGWVYDKWSFYTLHVASKEMPQYKAEEPWASESFMTIFGIEGVDQLLAHWDNVVAGKIDMNNFGGHSTCESFFDPHLVHSPQGGEVSFFQMHAPYEIEGGWEKYSHKLQEAVLDKWERLAPNFTRDKVILTNAETPVDIEIRLPNMRRGSIKHGDYRPTQLNTFRPNIECSGHATPIEGLYVCGASTYPGGLVLGGPAYLAANKVAEDMGVKKWWKPTPEMERFTKTYML